jgi:hypothetical protein
VFPAAAPWAARNFEIVTVLQALTHTGSAARRVRVAGAPPTGDLVVEVLGFHPRPQTVAVATRAGWGDIVLQL